MDRHRGDRSRGPSRWSDGPPQDGDHPFRHPNGHPRGGGEGFFGARHHPYRGGGAHDHHHPGDGERGPGFRPGPSSFERDGGPRRGGGFPGPARNASSPSDFDGHKFAKLFIGGVPRTATEDEIRPFFEEHGQVMEVALIKDRRTGQQQSCCFVKYATSDEADRAIRALHNQCILPGGIGPIQVRYADGERERLGTVEHKLFVGALHKQATEQEVEEIFAPYGRVEDVYIMRDEYKQSRGCGFVKFSNREFAAEAINALNGVYRMRGCDQPLIVRFADPKRPRPGEARGGPAFGGPGFGPRHPAPSGPQPSSSFDEPIGSLPNKVWSSTSPEPSGPSSHGFGGYGGHLHPTPFPAPSSTGFSPACIQPMGQQMPALQKPLTSPQHLLESVQAHPSHQNASPYQQTQGSQAQAQQLSQLQNLSSGNFMTLPPGLASMQLPGSSGQVPSSQPQLHMSASANLEVPTHLQQAVSVPVNQQILPGSAASQLLQHPVQQPAQMTLQPQQTHFLQTGFQSSHQILSQNRQVQLMQPSNPNQQQNTQQSSQTASHQSFSSSQVAMPISVVPSMMTSLHQQNNQAGVPISCNWSEHTSPDGFKYYYNCVTKESKWEKPEELTLMEQQQQKLVAVQQLPSQPQIQASQVQSTHQLSQVQQSQPHMQFIQQVQLQHLQPLPVPRMQQ